MAGAIRLPSTSHGSFTRSFVLAAATLVRAGWWGPQFLLPPAYQIMEVSLQFATTRVAVSVEVLSVSGNTVPIEKGSKMDRKQIFGWTEPYKPREGMARTLMAFSRPDGPVDIEMRDRDGRIVTASVEAGDLLELGSAALDADTMGTLERAKSVGAILAETVKATGGKQMFYLTMMGDSTRAEVFPESGVLNEAAGDLVLHSLDGDVLVPRPPGDDSPLEEAKPGEGASVERGERVPFEEIAAGNTIG